MTELARALNGNSAFAPPANILQAIPDALAHHKPGASPHSIYEEVWHMAFWQDISFEWIQGKPTPYPEHASLGFPSALQASQELWPTLQARFLAGTEHAAALADGITGLDKPVACPRAGAPDRVMTVGEQLESLAAHNAYHLGRVVLLRQLLGNWPPPAGGDTW